MPEFSQQARRRTAFVVGVLFFMVAALVVRLLDLQVIRHNELQALARDIVMGEIPLRAGRGHIFDRTGRPLALNEKGTVMWVDAEQFKVKSAAAAISFAELCQRQDSETLASIMSGKEKGFLLCARWLEAKEIENLQRLLLAEEVTGVYQEIEPRRVYPYGELTAPVLGYLVDRSKPAFTETTVYDPIGGVEQFHDAQLRGIDGQVIMERDPLSYAIPIGMREEYPARDGADLTLTLDLNIQYMAAARLNAAIEQAGARRGDVIVMDPRTGAILAIATNPTFDPTKFVECNEDPQCAAVMYRNPAIGLHYEPGSTMKILTMAIALEEGIVYPDWSFECSGGTYVDGVYFHNWDGKAHGHETLGEILMHSCNVGAITVGRMIPPETYYRYLDRLGFGHPTGIDLFGELSGTVVTSDVKTWTNVDQAANVFGQGIDVTPIQLAAAVAAVANGGELYKPYIVQAIAQGGVVTTTLPILRTRVFHREVCRQVTEMLVAAADTKGENGGPLIPGYRVALKTGTAQIPIPGDGYEPHRTIASAIGYAPADDPRFLILVRIEGNSLIWGEQVAVPALAQLASDLLTYLRIPPMGEVSTGP